ncbi:hypothetical protein Ahy_A07g035563 [Arachis hypogaea]|uniref:Uncharacterized protein n=1 Tax=Arachis hypogaea TaxID=3818 RepID=A0A445CE41_ARAHY|nr:hypothetical protein Ahy_A07g035563 [Arachis hypogaea]
MEVLCMNIFDDVFTSFVDINDHVLFALSETKGYLDHGDCNYTYTWCGAGFWYAEHVIRESKVSQPVFSMCCLKGKVQLLLLKEPPEFRTGSLDSILIEDLLKMLNENNIFPHGNQLLYSKFPNHSIYLRDSQEWVPRQRGFSIGRLTFIHVGSGEIFYLCLLLNVQRGCKSFESTHTVDGVAACNALGLLSDDQEFIDAIKETA